MSILKLYRYKDKVVIPAIAITKEGLLVESLPVEVCDVEDPRLPSVIEECLARTPQEEQPGDDDGQGPKSIVLEALHLKKWKDLEQNALLYTLFRSRNDVQIHVTGRGDDGFWKRDDSLMILYSLEDANSTLSQNLARAIIERKPVEEKPVRLLGGPPPALPPARDL